MTVTDTWTLDEFYAAHDGGEFEGRRVELVCGKVCEVSPESKANRDAIADLQNHLVADLASHGLSGRWRVGTRAGVITTDSYVEPDIAITPRDLERDETPSDCAVIIEVANATVKRDEGTKLKLYRSQGAKLYYVIDLAGPTLTRWGQTTSSLSVPKLGIEIGLDDLWRICGLSS